MKLYKLEAVRGFAALYVVLHHTVNIDGVLSNLFKFGQEAVILFFFMSGFVIHYSFQKSNVKTFSRYFSSRFYRLYIPLICIYILGYLASSLRQGYFIDPEFINLLQNILMLQDIDNLKPAVLATPYMGNSPLWSLSYEWWFYMLYFPLCNQGRKLKNNMHIVFIISCLGAALYVIEPSFISRIAMYFSIWFCGVYMAELYLSGIPLNIKSLRYPLLNLLVITIILSVNVAFYDFNHNPIYIGVHPILEFRHFLFALVILPIALLWKKYNWLGFDLIFKPFIKLAPISYVMYISHSYLVSSAGYFSFFNNAIVEWIGYMIVLFVFSYFIEIIVYKKIKQAIIGFKPTKLLSL